MRRYAWRPCTVCLRQTDLISSICAYPEGLCPKQERPGRENCRASVLCGPGLSPSISAGRDPLVPGKYPGKIAYIAEAAVQRNFRYRAGGKGQLLARLFHPIVIEIVDRGPACHLGEGPAEILWVHPRHRRQFTQCNGAVITVAYIGEHILQPQGLFQALGESWLSAFQQGAHQLPHEPQGGPLIARRLSFHGSHKLFG